MGLPSALLLSSSREAEERRKARGERGSAEGEEVVVEVLALRDEDSSGDARPRTAPGEALGRLLPFHVVVARDDEPRDAVDQRRQASDGRAFAVAKLGVEAQRREAATRETPRMEIAFRVGAVDGAATPPEAARRLGGIV